MLPNYELILKTFHSNRNGDKQIVNEAVGYLVRTKSIEFADGGVASGCAVLDSMNLF